jgi:hypothetical protein
LELGCVSTLDSNGRTIFVADAHGGELFDFLRVGAKVTITYTMSATEVELKPEKGAKPAAKKP